MTPLKAGLIAVKNLLKDPTHWHKGLNYARNSEGSSVSVQSDGACSWCLGGALVRILGPQGIYAEAWDHLETLLRKEGPHGFYWDPIVFNDDPTTTHRDVIRLLDWAIRSAPDA